MALYEILTPISNGRKPPHAIGKVREFEGDEAEALLALGAIRAVAGEGVEAGGKPVGTDQRATAAASGEGNLNFVTMAQALRTDLDKLTVKELDKIVADEKVELEGSPNKAGKIEAIVSARSVKLLGQFDRAGLLDLAAASGFADATALDLAEDADEDEIRAALIRVAAAKAD